MAQRQTGRAYCPQGGHQQTGSNQLTELLMLPGGPIQRTVSFVGINSRHNPRHRARRVRVAAYPGGLTDHVEDLLDLDVLLGTRSTPAEMGLDHRELGRRQVPVTVGAKTLLHPSTAGCSPADADLQPEQQFAEG